MLDSDIVNFNYIGEFVVKPLKIAGTNPTIPSGWVQSLINARDDLKERADALLAAWPSPSADGFESKISFPPLPSAPVPRPSANDPEVRFAVETRRSRRLDIEDMIRDLEALREKTRKPMALKLYDFSYMPDGRSIDWPSGLKALQREIALRLDLPTLDFAPVVQRYGPANILKKDQKCGHFLPMTFALQAEFFYDFLADTLGRPYLETYPE